MISNLTNQCITFFYFLLGYCPSKIIHFDNIKIIVACYVASAVTTVVTYVQTYISTKYFVVSSV